MYKISKFVLIAVTVSVLIADCFAISISKTKQKVELARYGKIEDYGGYDASIGQFPWYAHIEGHVDSTFVKQCGGTIISSRFVMTEAFCGIAPTSYHLYFGDTNFPTSSNPVISNIFISHPLFNYPSWLSNNIALIQLPLNIAFNLNVQAISLPSQDVDLTAINTFFVGTRLIDLFHEIRWNFLEIITNEECSTSDSTILCTVGPTYNLNQKPCALNDGSALAYIVNNTWIQVGISSLPSFCDSTVSGIFTRVGQYIPWISAITGLTV